MVGVPTCVKCCSPIGDSYLTKINDKSFHTLCAVCDYCSRELTDVCFVNGDGKILCRIDYYKNFSQKCASCNQPVISHELIMRAKQVNDKEKIYHAACFCCSVCCKRLVQGDMYKIHPKEGTLLCKMDFYEYMKNNNFEDLIPTQVNSKPISNPIDESSNGTGKKGRTVLSEPQRNQLMKVFEKDQRPNKASRERLSLETGVPVRVIQVWFQNQRAREKRLAGLSNSEKDKFEANYDNNDFMSNPGSNDVPSNYLDKNPSAGAPSSGYTQNYNPQDLQRSSYNTNPLSPTQSLLNLFSR